MTADELRRHLSAADAAEKELDALREEGLSKEGIATFRRLYPVFKRIFHQEVEEDQTMPYEQRPNTGTLFPNDRKAPDSNQPDWKGTIDVNGEQLEIAAWTRQGKRGEFLSLKVSPKREGGRP